MNRAPLWRSTTSDCHCQGTKPPSNRPQLLLRGPSEVERASKKLFVIGLVKRKLPSPPRRTLPESAQVCTARAHRKRAALMRSFIAKQRIGFKSKRAQAHLSLCCLRCFCFRHPRVGTPCLQAGVLPRKFYRSSHRPQAAAPLTHTTRRSQHLPCLTQPRE